MSTSRYAEWLWAEHDGVRSDKTSARAWEKGQDKAFWKIKIGDPGPDQMFSAPVYDRGAMTLHQLRKIVTSAGSGN